MPDNVRNAIFELRDALDMVGISDSGREYKVYGFTSAHIGDDRLGKALRDLFELLEGDGG